MAGDSGFDTSNILFRRENGGAHRSCVAFDTACYLTNELLCMPGQRNCSNPKYVSWSKILLASCLTLAPVRPRLVVSCFAP